MKGLRLYKKEKLCSKIAIDTLFSRGADVHTAMAYPVRAIWRSNATRFSDAPITFLISVPKKRLRHAVDRVLVRRRIREAYRLARASYPVAACVKVDLAFIYVADKIYSYSVISEAVGAILAKIQNFSENLRETTQANPDVTVDAQLE